MKDYITQRLGEFRGSPRFYKEGRRLMLAGFKPGTTFAAEAHQEKGMLVLKIDAAGSHKVSRKTARSGAPEDIPVIDINNRELLGMFEGLDQVRVIVRDGQVVILALATEVRRKEREERLVDKLRAGMPLDMGSFSHGIGVLSHALHTGLVEAGVSCRMKLACDIEETYLAQAETVNDCWNTGTVKVTAPLQEFAMDEWAMQSIGSLDICEAGIPCTAASHAGRAKKGLAKPEDDPDVGHLIHGFLVLIARLNPAVVLLENVEAYQSTASMSIFRSQLRDMGYEVHERILAARDFGALENRRRLCAVGVSKGLSFSFDDLALPISVVRTVAEILDPVPDDDPSWSAMQYLKDKEVRDKAEGKGFMMQLVRPTDTKVPTITRGYNKRRSTDPFLVSESNPDLLRLFTTAEHARIKGVPAHLIDGMSATRGHEALGQGICYEPFRAIGSLLGECLMKLASVSIEPAGERKAA